jgi:phage gp36-like protein
MDYEQSVRHCCAISYTEVQSRKYIKAGKTGEYREAVLFFRGSSILSAHE